MSSAGTGFAWERFSAEVAPSRITLRYRHLFGPRLSITLSDVSADGSWRVPASYQFLEPSLKDSRPYAIIKIVAAPGVSVSLDGFPPLPYDARPTLPMVEIIRVQDPELVPPIGFDFNNHHLMAEYELGHPFWPDPDASRTGSVRDFTHKLQAPMDYLSVVPLHNGVILRHHWSRQDLIITVPTCAQDIQGKPGAYNGNAKFYVQVNPGASVWSPSQGRDWLPVVEVVRTPDVLVEVARMPKEFALTAWTGTSASTTERFWQIYETDKISRVPDFGERFLKPSSSWRHVSVDGVSQPVVVSPALAAMDLAVRFVPGLGDAIDIMEFTDALFTGRDLYGRKLSTSDIVMMGVGALLPYSVPSMRRAGSAVAAKVFGRKTAKAQTLLERISRLSKQDADLAREVADAIKKGRHVSTAQLQKYVKICEKLKGTPPSAGLLLNVDQTGFTHADLQAAYRSYLVSPGTRKVDPLTWVIRTRNPAAMRLLRSVLGQGYAKSALRSQAGRAVNLFEVPRPADLPDDKAATILRDVFSRPKHDLRKLEGYLGVSVRGLDPDLVLKQLPTVNPVVKLGLLNPIKGELLEIMSRDLMLKHLDDAVRLKPNYRRARLYQDVMIRVRDKATGKLGPPRQFTDGIIGYHGRSGFQAIIVFESKSGYRGGQEATKQTFDWVEGRLTDADGSVLVFPKGARETLPDGTTRLLETELRYIYDPAAAPKRHVVGLNNARRVMITAKGKSLLGINSADQIATGVIRQEATMTAEELEQATRLVVRVRPPKSGEEVFVRLPQHVEDVSSAQLDWLAAQIVAKVARRAAIEADGSGEQ
ncbi:hypothetical protein [Micromonospora sp. NPDC126480]|uniref:hypothetical protein n=1 Tax=Micromonospora sp. NPDC126480 TaxID=3155312 RepID=UPI00331FF418